MKLTTASEVPQCSGKRSGKMKAMAASSTRLVAVTAAGPVYEGVVPGVRVPLPSFLALLQELAARADNPRSEVVSSMAQRVHGTDAHEMWNYLGAGFGLRLSQAAPATRVAALRGDIRLCSSQRRSGWGRVTTNGRGQRRLAILDPPSASFNIGVRGTNDCTIDFCRSPPIDCRGPQRSDFFRRRRRTARGRRSDSLAQVG